MSGTGVVDSWGLTFPSQQRGLSHRVTQRRAAPARGTRPLVKAARTECLRPLTPLCLRRAYVSQLDVTVNSETQNILDV